MSAHSFFLFSQRWLILRRWSECGPNELFSWLPRGQSPSSKPSRGETNCTAQYHQSVIDNAREAERQMPGRPLAIALDTASQTIGIMCDSTLTKTISQKGPEIRTGNTVNDEDFPINAGDEIVITTDDKYKTASNNKFMSASQ